MALSHDIITSRHTITTHLKIDDIADPNIDDAQESLILLFEFLLIEDLNRQNAVLVDSPASPNLLTPAPACLAEWTHHVQIKRFIPIRIQCLLDDRGRMGLLASDGGHSERIGESYIDERQSTPLNQLTDPQGEITYGRHRVYKDRPLR